MNVSEKTVEELREEFRKLREIAMYSATLEEWMAAVTKLLPENPTPADWVEAARNARTTCNVCHGSGVYYWGACVNGVMTHSGPCFRCQSVGTQGQADYKRNWGYDNFGRRGI